VPVVGGLGGGVDADGGGELAGSAGAAGGDGDRVRHLARSGQAGDGIDLFAGQYGIRQFTAVINPPQAATLAVGEAVRQPVVHGDQVAIATTMTLTLSIDHRALDGATAARFLTRLRELIEQPLDIVL
jgi:pyruvate dehydrogenase E2 component (dihydrolipoyllysine-residue acetyltransferase)